MIHCRNCVTYVFSVIVLHVLHPGTQDNALKTNSKLISQPHAHDRYEEVICLFTLKHHT